MFDVIFGMCFDCVKGFLFCLKRIGLILIFIILGGGVYPWVSRQMGSFVLIGVLAYLWVVELDYFYVWGHSLSNGVSAGGGCKVECTLEDYLKPVVENSFQPDV